MAKNSYLTRELESEHGDLHEVIPALADNMTLAQVARELGCSQATVSRWLSDNGYVRVSRWVQMPEVAHG